MSKLYFSMSELIASDTANRYKINNVPDVTSMNNLLRLIWYCLQPIREKIGRPIIITSGFRSKTLNKAIGGSPTSHHCTGCAADFHVDGMSIPQTIDFIRKSGVPFTQLIDEGTWVHISFIDTNLKKEVLKYRNGVYTKY